MKNLFKRFTAVIAAVLIFCISFVPSSVSAAGSFPVPDNNYVVQGLFDEKTYKNAIFDLYENPVMVSHGFNSDNTDIMIYHDPDNNRFLIFVFDSTKSVTWNIFDYFDGSKSYFCLSGGATFLYNYNVSSLDSLSSIGLNEDNSYNNAGFVICYDSSTDLYFPAYRMYNNGWKMHTRYNYDSLIYSHNLKPSAAEPDEDSSGKLTFTGVRLGVDKKGFLEWLITEGKESVINSTGYSFTQKQLSLLVDVFDSYGNSLFWFHSSLIKTFALTQHSLKGTSALLSTLQQLYRDYLDYKNSIEIVEITPDHSGLPHWRQDKTDNTLVTDQEDDTTILSLLREILRTLMYLPSSIRTSFSDLATNLVSIMYNWNRLFDKLDYLSPDINFDISEDVDRLIEAINNISSNVPDTSIDVTITDEKQQELDDFFNGWSVDFDNKVKEKFPVTVQLGELFNDDFFEKCGIDCNGDGEVYSYYSENVYAVSETSTVSELSASSPGSDQKLVTDFLGQFDSADVNFLNDANFSSSVPDWSITVGGKKCEVFSFKLYAKYRTQIHFIMSFILWTVYLLSLYKSLPQIIGQVSDVVHGIEKM